MSNQSGLVLVCKICRWMPPGDLQMALVEAHFDLEPDHDPTDIKMEMVCWCGRCAIEMSLDRSTTSSAGTIKHHYSCPGCHRSKTIVLAGE